MPNSHTYPGLRFAGDTSFSGLTKLSFNLAAFVILAGIVVLIGWQFDIVFLRRPLPELAAMNPATAICFILSGIAFITLIWKEHALAVKWSRTLCVLIIIIGAVNLLQIAIGSDWRIDQLFFQEKIKGDRLSFFSRMAINTALGFILFSVALLLLQSKSGASVLTAHYLALIIFLFVFFQLLGYLYGAPEFYKLLSLLPMAVHTAICFMLLSLSIFLVFPDEGLTREFTTERSGRAVGLYLMMTAFMIPSILGGLRIYTDRIKLFSTPLGITLLVISIVVVFSAVCLYFIIALNKEDRLKRLSEERLHETREVFRSLVLNIKDYAIFRLDTKGHILTWNKGAEAIKGYREDEIIGKHIRVFYTAEDVKKDIPTHLLAMAKKEGQYRIEGWRLRKDGSLFWADVVVTALYDQQGTLNGFAKITRDTTESKKNKDLLSDFNRQLTRMVDEKTVELEKTTDQLRQLASYLQTAREEERKNLAREMHDELGQMLTGLRMDMVWLKKHAAGHDMLQARFDSALDLLADTRQIMRRLATELHPAMLEDLGLTVALSSYGREFESRFSIKINFSFDLDGLNEMDIAQEMTIAIYRIFQESLNNVAKHAKATEVTAVLQVAEGKIMLSIRDNGQGFDVSSLSQKKSLGLVSIRERTLMMGGQSDITSSPGKGTTVFIEAPLKLEQS